MSHHKLINCICFIAVLSLSNGIAAKEGGEEGYSSNSEYFIKCPQCQKGCQTFQALKEHLETSHSAVDATAAITMENGTASASSPSPSVGGGSYNCSQCTTSFAAKDQLEKHELLHSPNSQVVSYILMISFTQLCLKNWDVGNVRAAKLVEITTKCRNLTTFTCSYYFFIPN